MLYDTFDLYSEVSKITDLEVAKMVIKRCDITA